MGEVKKGEKCQSCDSVFSNCQDCDDERCFESLDGFFYKLMVRNALLIKIYLQAANSAQLLFIVNNVRKSITWNIFHSVF